MNGQPQITIRNYKTNKNVSIILNWKSNPNCKTKIISKIIHLAIHMFFRTRKNGMSINRVHEKQLYKSALKTRPPKIH